MLKRTLATLLFLNLSPTKAMEASQDNDWDDFSNSYMVQNSNNQKADPDISKKSKRNDVANEQLPESDQKKRKVELEASQIDLTEKLEQIDIKDNTEMTVEIKPPINYQEDLDKMYRYTQRSPGSLIFQELDKFTSEKYKNIDRIEYYYNLVHIESDIIDKKCFLPDLSPEEKIETIIEIVGHLDVLALCTERLKRAFELRKAGF